MVHDVARLEVRRANSNHHLIRSRDFSSFNCQFADTTEREASEKFAIRDRRELKEMF
jgi:hypothetical protein